MKLLRLKVIIPVIVIIILGAIFLQPLAGWIVRKAIVSTGEAVFGAKVDVNSVKVRMKNMFVEITGLEIGDRNDEWKNLVQADSMKFGMRFYPLLSKKLIIDDMSLENLAWGTTRKTSGALPPKKTRKVKDGKEETLSGRLFSSLKGKMKGEVESLPVMNLTGDIKNTLESIDAEKLVAGADLKAPGRIDAMGAELKDRYSKYIAEVGSLDITGSIEAARQAVNEIGDISISRQEDIKSAQEKISALNNQKKALEKTSGRINALKKEIGAGLADTKKITGEIDKLISQDYKSILSKVKLPEVSKKGMAGALFGRMWYDRVNKVLFYMKLARKYMPPRKKKQDKIEIDRERGTDIVFYRKESLPGLLVSRVNVSGTTGGEGKDNANAFSVEGRVFDVSSDQVLHGKPMRIDIKGQQRGRQYTIGSVFDHTGEVPVDSLLFNVDNVTLTEFNPLEGSDFPAMESGKLDMDSVFKLEGDRLDCRMSMEVSRMKFTDTSGTGIIGEVLSSIDKLEIKASLYGRPDNLKTRIESNLDDIISKKLKAIYGKKVKELKAKIKSELNKAIESKKKELIDNCGAQRKELLAKCSTGVSDIQKEKAVIDRKIGQVSASIKQVTEKVKKEAERKVKEKAKDEIKKKLPSGLKKLF